MSQREKKIDEMLERRLESLTLVAESTYLRHNLSAILRSAESFGVQDVHLIAEQKNKISGAAKGSEKWVSLNFHSSTEGCLTELKKKGFGIWVADLHPEAHTPDTLPIDRPVALVMGTELSGVSQIAKDMADGFVVIPMQGLTQSLNVSVASACLLYRLSTRMREANSGAGDLCRARRSEFKTELLARERAKKESRRKRKELARKQKKKSPPIGGGDPLP